MDSTPNHKHLKYVKICPQAFYLHLSLIIQALKWLMFMDMQAQKASLRELNQAYDLSNKDKQLIMMKPNSLTSL